MQRSSQLSYAPSVEDRLVEFGKLVKLGGYRARTKVRYYELRLPCLGGHGALGGKTKAGAVLFVHAPVALLFLPIVL